MSRCCSPRCGRDFPLSSRSIGIGRRSSDTARAPGNPFFTTRSVKPNGEPSALKPRMCPKLVQRRRQKVPMGPARNIVDPVRRLRIEPRARPGEVDVNQPGPRLVRNPVGALVQSCGRSCRVVPRFGEGPLAVLVAVGSPEIAPAEAFPSGRGKMKTSKSPSCAGIGTVSIAPVWGCLNRSFVPGGMRSKRSGSNCPQIAAASSSVFLRSGCCEICPSSNR